MQLVAGPEDAGKRADLVVAHRAGFARAQIARAVQGGSLRVNGAPVKGSFILSRGDVVECDVQPAGAVRAEPEAIDLPIVYEDSDIIVIDKPAGMVTHPAHGATSGTLVNALLAHERSQALSWEEHRAGLIHRLDRDTSGLLLAAKTPEALAYLGKAMKARAIRREYLGLVHGVPQQPRGTLEGPIGRDPRNRLKFAVTADGKPAITHYEILERLHGASELLFRLETGRTHQIRVHMAALGHSIINDPLYGKSDRRFDLPGQALHAWRLVFQHPSTGVAMEFETAPPPEYQHAKELLS